MELQIAKWLEKGYYIEMFRRMGFGEYVIELDRDVNRDGTPVVSGVGDTLAEAMADLMSTIAEVDR
jgi:hypothetical protein